MIKSLELINWRTHKNTSFEFDNGTNILIGVMGSGKSSVVNALSYSLFGTFPALKSKQVSLDEIIMNKPNKCSETQTKLIFTHKEKQYLVQRIIKETGTNEAKVYENETLIAGPKQRDVNEKIEHILGLNYELFSRAVYAEQNEMDFFLKLTPSERKKKFDELLELEKYEIARQNSLKLKNQIIKDNKQKNELIKQQKETLNQYEEDKLIEKITFEEKEITSLNTEKELVEKELIEKNNTLKNEEQKEKEYKRIKDDLTRSKSKQETLKNSLKDKKEIDLTKIDTENKIIEEKIKLEKNNKEEFEKQKEEFDNASKQISEENKVLEYKLKQIDTEEKEINTLGGTCPTCKQELTKIHKNTLKEEWDTKKQQIQKKQEELQNKKNELKKILDELNEQIKITNKNIEEQTQKIYINQNLKREAQDYFKMKNELDLIEREIPKKEEELKNIDFDENTQDKIRRNYFETKTKMELILNKIKSKIELKKSFEENLSKIKLIKENLDRLEKEHKDYDDAKEKLGVFENCLISTQTELRQNLLETINEAMSQIWSAIYPYHDFIDARLSVVENGYDLQVLTKNQNWHRVEGILSGGERSAAALCIRIAFALVLTKQLSMLILDEPTHNLDFNAVEKLSEMLRESMPSLVDQIFVITHDKQLESGASSSLYTLERNKDLDEATRVEKIQIV